jgi:hypothetical protein
MENSLERVSQIGLGDKYRNEWSYLFNGHNDLDRVQAVQAKVFHKVGSGCELCVRVE